MMSLQALIVRLKSWPARLCDPAFRPELIRRLKRQAANVVGQNKSAISSSEWCAHHAVTLEQALQDLSIPEIEFPPEVVAALQEAEMRVKNHLQRHYIGPANLNLLYALCRYKKPKKVLETGVAHGWSSLIILLALEGQGLLISNDLPPTYSFDEDYVGVAVPEGVRYNWILHRSADREGLSRIASEGHRFDLAHYDSDKTYDGRIFGYHQIWDLLEPGGILISDDIVDNHAFKDFCAKQNLNPVIIRDSHNDKYEGLVIKAS
jgi:predicted O-methyltransferase YrrM